MSTFRIHVDGANVSTQVRICSEQKKNEMVNLLLFVIS